jgi:putative membrane protein
MQSVSVVLALQVTWSAERVALSVLTIAIVAFGAEVLGVSSGIPFGRYEYTDALAPQIIGVPILISLAWVMMLAPSWAVAWSIMGNSGSRAVHALLSGLTFSAWDLYLDPQMVDHGLWTWLQPGGYFGVPWINFVGWAVTAALITFLLSPRHLDGIRLMLIYTLTWIFQGIALGFFWGQPGPAICGFLGMGVFVGWSWHREIGHWTS